MKRRVFSLVLILSILLGMQTVSAASGMDNFKPVRTYDDRFTDVAAGDWYAEYVKSLYELSLTEGRTAVSFGAAEYVKVEEVITFAARIRSLYDTGSAEAGPEAYPKGPRWSDHYLDYLQALGAVGTEFDQILKQPATRAQAAGILAHALPEEALEQRNGAIVTEGYAMGFCIRDVTAYTPYQPEILNLYKWGILEGMDSKGSFYPDQNVRRREIAAMLSRLVNEDLRLTITWELRDDEFSVAGTTLSELVPAGTFQSTHALDDMTAIDENVRWMLSRSANTISLTFGPNVLTEETASALMDRYLNTARQYIEQGYNAINCVYQPGTGDVTLTFSSNIFGQDTLLLAQQSALESAIQVHDQLWMEGKITEAMTEAEKALVYFDWLAEHTDYDDTATAESLSHSAYGLFQHGLAVCDGYTAAYNLLLKLEGIQCHTCSAGDHIWTVATLDGRTVHSDITWGDQDGYIAYTYFDMSQEAALARF